MCEERERRGKGKIRKTKKGRKEGRRRRREGRSGCNKDITR
jgi:hypothetical protein